MTARTVTMRAMSFDVPVMAVKSQLTGVRLVSTSPKSFCVTASVPPLMLLRHDGAVRLTIWLMALFFHSVKKECSCA